MVTATTAFAKPFVDIPALIRAKGQAQAAGKECLACEGHQVVTLSPKIRDRDNFSVVGCSQCGLSHLEPFPAQMAAYYRQDYREDTNPDILAVRAGCAEDNARRCDTLLPRLGPNCRLLDFGCGSGAFLHAARFRSQAQLAGIELHDAFRAHLRQEGFDVRPHLTDFKGSVFDIVLLSHVLEHTETPVQVLAELRQYLAPGGIVAIEVPSLTDALLWVYRIPAFWAFYWQFPHIWYFSPETLQAVIEQAGFRMERLEGMQRYGLMNHFQWLNEGRPGKGERFAPLVAGPMDEAYRAALIKQGVFDTIWMECTPRPISP